MNLKQFLKPDWRKIVIFVVVSIVLSLFPLTLGSIDFFVNQLFIKVPMRSGVVQGIPIPFYFCMLGGVVVYPEVSGLVCNFIYYIFIIDILIWYILSCLIVWIYDKVNKK